MKKAVALALALLVWGCSSQPTLEEGGKAGVEERTPGAGKPGGPSTAPVTPGAGIGVQPLPSKPVAPSQARGANPLTDPASPLSKRSVFYDYDSDAIKEEYRPVVQAHGKYLAGNPDARMLVQGNCDERGSREYNIALGQRRADALKRMLTLLGARDNQIETVSLGEEKPRCSEKDEACFQQNRRSDMLYNGEF